MNKKLFILGSAFALAACKHSPKPAQVETEEKKTDSVELVVNVAPKDTYGNIALFEANRSKIKYCIAFVENFAPEAYYCGKDWTVGHGLTILYSADGKSSRDVVKGDKITLAESDVYLGRYLTFEVLRDINECVTVSMDENTLLATCVFRYCVGASGFKKSEFLKQLNAGATGKNLAKYFTRFRRDGGVIKRSYFFAVMMAEKITFDDLLDLRAEGCYSLWLSDVCVCKTKGRTDEKANLSIDKDNCAIFKYDNVQKNLERAKITRVSPKIGACKMVRDIVPLYIQEELYGKNAIAGANTSETVDDKIIAHDAAIEKYRLGDTLGARNDLVELTKSGYDCALLENDIAFISYQIGEYRTAISAGKKALKLAETAQDSSAAFYNIGISYEARGNYWNAVKNLQSAVATSPNNTNKKALQRVLDLQSQQKKRGFGCSR